MHVRQRGASELYIEAREAAERGGDPLLRGRSLPKRVPEGTEPLLRRSCRTAAGASCSEPRAGRAGGRGAPEEGDARRAGVAECWEPPERSRGCEELHAGW